MLSCNIAIRNLNEIHIDGSINFDNANNIMALGCQFIAKVIAVNINLKNLKYADSSALVVILAWVRYTNKNNKTIKIYEIPKFLLDLIRVSNLDQILPIESDF